MNAKNLLLLSFVIILPVVLTSCTTAVPIESKSFPEVPSVLLIAPAPLLEATDSPDFDVLLSTVTANYAIALINAERLRTFQEWYRIQKDLYTK